MDGARFGGWARLVGRGMSRRDAAKAAGGGLLVAALAGQSPRVIAQEATPGAGPAACPTTTPEENKELVERYLGEIWTAGGDARVEDLLAADHFHRWGVGGDTVGPEAFTERLRMFLAAFPDFAIRVDQLVAEGDHVVSRWTATATHRGEWLGIPATERPVEYTGMNVFRIACGRIVEAWGEADHLGLLRQLGGAPDAATPAAATPAT